MSGIKVFLVSLLLLFSITLGYPALPPGDQLYDFLHDFLGIPEIIFSFLGFSSEVLLKGVINGVLWGFFISMIYGFGRRVSKSEVIIVHAPISTPASIPLQQLTVKTPVTIRKRKTYVPFLSPLPKSKKLDRSIETIEGIGHIYGNMLRVSGVKVVDDLLRAGSTKNGRRDLAFKVGISPTMILKWVNQADFFRIRGIGKQYADLLDTVGVNTVVDLSRRKPWDLYDKLRETNRKMNLVKRIPPYRMIEGWIKSSKRLTRIVY